MDIHLKLFLFKCQEVKCGVIRRAKAEGRFPSEAASTVSTERESTRRAGPETKQEHLRLEGCSQCEEHERNKSKKH